MDQAWRGPEPDDSRTFGLYRTSWPRLDRSLSVFDSGALSYSARQTESASRQEALARQSGSHEVLGRTVSVYRLSAATTSASSRITRRESSSNHFGTSGLLPPHEPVR